MSTTIFDAIVAENGAVLIVPGVSRPLVASDPLAVSEALTARGVAHRNGQVLVACGADDEPVALEVIRPLGLDCQLVRNRGELMILPAGVTKGTGLLDALGSLGYSRHNTIGVGDAENDHSLIDVCEIGVAVANAVDALRVHADVVLDRPDGQGVADLLRGPLLAGRTHVYPRRWRVTLGRDDGGTAVTIPASQLNVAVCGGTGEGKSYLAGLICEQLVGLGYSLVVFDPEGDHVGLGELRDVLVTGDRDLPARRPLRGGAAAPPPRRHGRCRPLPSRRPATSHVRDGPSGRDRSPTSRHRAPQWVVVDEAHGPLGRAGRALGVFDPSAKGYLLVTWQPQELSADALAALDVVIALGSPHPDEQLVDLTAAVADMPRAEIARLLDGPVGRAVLAWRQQPGEAVAFTLGRRSTPHLRHEHKYGHAGVEPAHRFHFRAEPDIPTGAIAANLADLEAELVRCNGGVLRHHCPRHDFSRWVAGVFHDQPLAGELAAAEARLPVAGTSAIVEQVRLALVATLQNRRAR